MVFGNFFSPPEVKVLKKFVSKFLDEAVSELPLISLSRNRLIREIKSDMNKMADTKEMLAILTDSSPPHPEYQALHGIGQIVIHYLGRPPLVDIGSGSFCSADYRDASGQLTDEGKDLRTIGHAVIKRIIDQKHEDKNSEYVLNFIDVIDDATKPNTNRHFMG